MKRKHQSQATESTPSGSAAGETSRPEEETLPAPVTPEEDNGETESIPISLPVSPEMWRQLKEQATQVDPPAHPPGMAATSLPTPAEHEDEPED